MKIKQEYQKIYRILAIFKNNLIKNFYLYLNLKKKGELLVYCGMNVGDTFNKIFYRYEKVIGFEANPDNYKILLSKFSKYKNVKIYNFAVGKIDGFCEFKIVKDRNFSASSSILDFHENNNIEVKKIIKIKMINLYNFFKKNNIEKIDTYISDIEGYDFIVLNTLKNFIKKKQIKNISCEVQINEHINYFKYFSESNTLLNFDKLLNENYELSGYGQGITKSRDFLKDINVKMSEKDCRPYFKTNDNFIDLTWSVKK